MSQFSFSRAAIGYFSYDLARRIERLPGLAHDAERMPEMALGIYDWAVVVDHVERRTWLASHCRDPETEIKWNGLVALFSERRLERARIPFRILASIESNMTRARYAQAFDRIKRYIAEGDCYQVNLAQRFSAPAMGDPWHAYQALRVLNPAPFAAYLSTPYGQILSASPSAFSSRVRSRRDEPSKHAAPRRTPAPGCRAGGSAPS